MGYFVDTNGQYYEGDKISPSDQSVVKRNNSDETYINGSWVFNATNYRDKLNILIDNKAEEIRKKYLTSYPLQGATYISKEADARAYKAAGYPTPFDEFTYQYVWAEMVANGDATAQIAADRIIYESDLYNNGTALIKGKGPLIEKERRAAKVAIAAAADKTALDAALATGISALDAL